MKITMKAARVNKGLTIAQVAEKMGVSAQSVISWEHGSYQMKLGPAMKLARLYGVSIYDIKWPGVEDEETT